jgi:cell division septum initiation protein DivIVA
MKKFVVGFIFGIVGTFLTAFLIAYSSQTDDIKQKIIIDLANMFFLHFSLVASVLFGITILYFLVSFFINLQKKANLKAKEIITDAEQKADEIINHAKQKANNLARKYERLEIKYKPIIQDKDNALKRLKEQNKDLKQVIFGSYKLAKKVKNGESHIDQLIRILKRGNNG